MLKFSSHFSKSHVKEELIHENSEQDDSENGVQTPPIVRLADKYDSFTTMTHSPL